MGAAVQGAIPLESIYAWLDENAPELPPEEREEFLWYFERMDEFYCAELHKKNAQPGQRSEGRAVVGGGAS